MTRQESKTGDARGGTFQVTLRLLRQFLPGEVRGLAAGLLLLLFASGAALLLPWPLKIVLDSVVGNVPPPAPVQWLVAPLSRSAIFSGNPPLLLLTTLCLGLLLLELLMGVCNVFSAYVLNSVALRMVFRLRTALFDHIQRQSVAFHDSKTVGDSLYRVTWDSYCIQSIFSEGVVPALTASVTLLGIALVMLTRDWRLTVAALAVAAPLMYLVRRPDHHDRTLLRVHGPRATSARACRKRWPVSGGAGFRPGKHGKRAFAAAPNRASRQPAAHRAPDRFAIHRQHHPRGRDGTGRLDQRAGGGAGAADAGGRGAAGRLCRDAFQAAGNAHRQRPRRCRARRRARAGILPSSIASRRSPMRRCRRTARPGCRTSHLRARRLCV